MAEKAQFTGVNEHFEAIFNAAEATQIVFQQPARTPFLFTPPPTKAKKNATPEDYWGRAGRMLSKPHKRDLVRQPPGMGSRRLLSILPARPASLLSKPRYGAPKLVPSMRLSVPLATCRRVLKRTDRSCFNLQ